VGELAGSALTVGHSPLTRRAHHWIHASPSAGNWAIAPVAVFETNVIRVYFRRAPVTAVAEFDHVEFPRWNVESAPRT